MIPGDTLLTGVRNAQNDMGVTSSITDDDVNAMKGKYLKDIAPQADPYGGIFQGNEEIEPETPPEPAEISPTENVSESVQVNTPENENVQ